MAHSLGQKEAVARLRANAERARQFSDLEGTWSGNTFTFAVSVQGLGLKGTVEVEEDALKFESRLPLIAMPFVGWLPRILKKALQERLDLGGELANKREMVAAQGESVIEEATGDATGDASPTVLFLHIPKAGGTTLGEFVFNQCSIEAGRDEGLLNAGVLFVPYGFFKGDDLSVPEQIRPLLRRGDLRAVVGHFWYGMHEQVARPCVYITLLRNPVERILSLYHYLKLEGQMSVEEFAASAPYREVDNDQTRRIAGVNPEIGGCTRETLRTAKENLRRDFAVVGVTERFDETLVLLKRRLGWTREVLSYPRNTNAERPPAASLSAEALDAVRLRNELDYELWQYATEMLDEAIASEGSGFREELERYRALAAAPAANAGRL